MAQIQWTDEPLDVPLVTSIETRKAGLSVDQNSIMDGRLVNCYVEFNKRENAWWIYKRYGYGLAAPLYSGIGNGLYNWLGDLYSFFGTTFYKNTASLQAGLDNTGQKPYRFVQVLGATPKLVFGNGTKAYYTDGAVVTQITDANFPSGAGSFCLGWAYLDGTLYVLRPDGGIQGSNINDPTTWNALNIIFANAEPDKGVALFKQLVYVVALKQWSTQVFYDAGNATGSPLSPVPGAALPYGCSDAGSVAEIDGKVFWLTFNRTVSPQIAMLENLQLTIVSTPAVERLLDKAVGFSTRAFCFKHSGHRMYIIRIPTFNYSLAYDIDQGLWFPWTDPTGVASWPIVDQGFDSANNHVLQHATNGTLYSADDCFTFPADAGSPAPVGIYTNNFDGGLDRTKNLPMMRFYGDQTSGSLLEVRYNDDDFQPTKWSNFRSVDLNLRRPTLPDCGSFYRRSWHLQHQSNTPFRMRSVYLQMDKGTL